MLKKNINYIELKEKSIGNDRRLEMLNEVLANGTFLPNTVEYKDIDSSFKQWVEGEMRIVNSDGTVYPTMSLYSNQRFSEYMQSWKYTDANNNLILDFKTISRENNPRFGKIHNGYYNIPGDIFFLMKRKKVLDDNGSESFLDLKMKQPTAIDISYKLTIFTTKYQDINKFNADINRKFSSRQVYLSPNGYYMPMTLENINDESKYEIEDRQFYSQTFIIKVNAFIITEDDFRVEEVPLKLGVNLPSLEAVRKKPEAEIEECEMNAPYYYKPIILTIKYPICKTNVANFTIDTDFICNNIEVSNVLNNYRIFVNGEEVYEKESLSVKNGDDIKITIKKRFVDKESTIVLNGYNPNVVYDERKDVLENENDITQHIDNKEIASIK